MVRRIFGVNSALILHMQLCKHFLFQFWIFFSFFLRSKCLIIILTREQQKKSLQNSIRTYLFRRLAYSKYNKNSKNTSTAKLVIKLRASFIFEIYLKNNIGGN